MTNSSLSYALKAAGFSAVALALAGCGCSSEPAAGEGAKEPATVSYSPNDVPAIQARALEAFAAGDLEVADAEFRRLTEDRSIPREAMSAGWDGRGVIAAKRISGKAAPSTLADEARCAFLKALVLDPGNGAARYNLASLYRDAFGYSHAAYVLFGQFSDREADGERAVKARGYAKKLALQAKSRRAKAKKLSKIRKTAEAFAWEEHSWNDAKANARHAENLTTAKMDAAKSKEKLLAAALGSEILAERDPSDAKSLALMAKVLARDLRAAGLAERAKVYEEFVGFLSGLK